MIRLKTAEEIRLLRTSGTLAAKVLRYAGTLAVPGMTTGKVDDLVREFILDHGAYPSPLNYPGRPTDPRKPKIDAGCFPASLCTSVNEVVTHGIPSAQVLRDGDIVNMDITVCVEGYHGDCSATFPVGEVSSETARLIEVTRRCMDAGIAASLNGAFLGDIGAAIQDIADSEGYSIVREYCGHGIGRRFHEEPQVLHYRDRQGPRLRKGMVFTVEPMINQGVWKTKLLDDGWTAVTADGKLSAQFEHTILVTDRGPEILTACPDGDD
jgi:methionyl aminopeptidase